MNAHDSIAREVLAAIAAVAGKPPVPLHEPCFRGSESAYLKECVDSTFVSSVGKFVDRFERDLVSFTGARHAIATVNGTAALHIALMLAGVRPGDEVLIPALTFVATANAVKYCGAVPHFIDADETNLGISAVALRAYMMDIASVHNGVCINRQTSRVIRAVVPMHTFGHIGDMPGVLEVAREYSLAVVEDAAESLGSWLGARHSGTIGLLGTLSFNGNKTITTGGGGAILTDDAKLAARAKHLTTTAKAPHRWEYVHDEVGYNYRMPNLNAALGCAQLEQLPSFIDGKRSLFERYAAAFATVGHARIVREPAGTRSNYWLQALLLNEEAASARDAILAATNAAGYMTRPAWALLHRLEPYRDCPRMALHTAEGLERRLINLPSGIRIALANP